MTSVALAPRLAMERSTRYHEYIHILLLEVEFIESHLNKIIILFYVPKVYNNFCYHNPF